MTTASVPRGGAAQPVREIAGVPSWVTATLRQDVEAGDVVHELAEALEDEIVGHPEVKEAEAKIEACLDRVAKIDDDLATDLGYADFDHYCSIVRATIAAVLARQAAAS
jgi:hypothetical protein